MKTLDQLNVQIFADGADIEGMIALYRNPLVQGLTTNPTLMRKAGIKDYEGFCREVLDIVKEKPISFEVFSDDFDEMRLQALKIQSWQDNVFVKIPITNTRGESTIPLIRQLSADGVQLNVTAILTLDQVRAVVGALKPTIAAVISVLGLSPITYSIIACSSLARNPASDTDFLSSPNLPSKEDILSAHCIVCLRVVATMSDGIAFIFLIVVINEEIFLLRSVCLSSTLLPRAFS
jgi:hypothetical protein